MNFTAGNSADPAETKHLKPAIRCFWGSGLRTHYFTSALESEAAPFEL